jgi:hypothetical protein
MHDRIKKMHQPHEEEFFYELGEILMAFADSIAKLQAEVNLLIAQNGPAAVAAAVAAKDASDAAAVDVVTATVVAAVAPAAPAA